MAIEFAFSDEQELFRRSVREFLESEIRPDLGLLYEAAEKHTFPRELVERFGRQGLMGVPVPEEYGGAGMGEVGYCILLEEVGRLDASLATIVGAHTGICAQPLYLYGSEEQRAKYLPKLARGEAVGAFALTEPQAGSDAANIQTRAVKEGDEYVLSGQKIYVTNGDAADYVMVSAVTDPALGARGGVTAFIVETELPGCKVGRVEDKMGIRGSTTAQLFFEDVKVPEENVLGKVGEGFVVALTALDGGRVALGVGTAGGAIGILGRTLEYVKLRHQFGRPIADFQSVQFMLADVMTETHVGRVAAYLAAEEVEHYYEKIAKGEPVPRHERDRINMQAGIVKVFCSEATGRAVDKCLQIYGARGYTEGFEDPSKGFRDHIISEIYEGTNEIQRVVIARDMLRRGPVLW